MQKAVILDTRRIVRKVLAEPWIRSVWAVRPVLFWEPAKLPWSMESVLLLLYYYFDNDIVCTVHRNQLLNKPTRCTFCMYLFYNLFVTLHVSNDYFVHLQEFINLLYLQLCTNHANVPNCSVLRLEPVLLFNDNNWHNNKIPESDYYLHAKHSLPFAVQPYMWFSCR